jgi:hypothetical protein
MPSLPFQRNLDCRCRAHRHYKLRYRGNLIRHRNNWCSSMSKRISKTCFRVSNYQTYRSEPIRLAVTGSRRIIAGTVIVTSDGCITVRVARQAVVISIAFTDTRSVVARAVH